MSAIKVNHADFYYELQGEGNPLIFISGYTSDHNLWAQQTGPLSEHFQVLTFDNRAAGQTKDDGCELSAELMADDIIALADALGLKKSHIIGSSMGGTIAQQVAIRHPDKVGKLGLMVTTAKWRSAMLKGISVGIAMREANIPFDVQFDSVLGWVFGEAFINNADNVNFLKELVLNDPYPQSLDDQKRQAVVLNNFDSRNDLQKITAPTLVMNGSEDILSLPEESQYLVDNIENAKPHTFNCAHAISAEQPAELTKVILDFFR
jgi:3-oxoadipate enol-lactonase